jgi:prepilin-type processing-associated H-X9-DG protein
MTRTAVTARRIVSGVLMIGCLAAPTAALAKLPSPKTTLIVPGVSIAGVKIGMNQTQVFHQWGSTKCIPALCTWQGPGNPSHAERATVSFFGGHVIQIDINAGTTNATNEKFKPGVLSTWKTGKNIHLGSTRASVKRAYPAAKANNSTGVAGWDLFNAATRHFTRFSSFGVGATPDRLRYIELACDTAGHC